MLWADFINADKGRFREDREYEAKEYYGFTPMYVMTASRLTMYEFELITNELAHWCENNCSGRYYIHKSRSSVMLELQEDAALIKISRAELA